MEIINANPNNIQFQEDNYLWRYLSFEKFESFIAKLSLWFSRIDYFDDKLEGRTCFYHANDIISKSFANADNFNKEENERLRRKGLELQKHFRDQFDRAKKTHYVSCWFFSKEESSIMYNQFSKKNGVALKIKANSLHNLILSSYPDVEDNLKLLYGFCNYLPLKEFNYEFLLQVINKKIQISSAVAFNKDISYSHEKEFRYAVVMPYQEKIEYPSGIPLYCLSPIIDDIDIIASPYMDYVEIEKLQNLTDYFIKGKKIKSSLILNSTTITDTIK